jgi:hypothetical protein
MPSGRPSLEGVSITAREAPHSTERSCCTAPATSAHAAEYGSGMGFGRTSHIKPLVGSGRLALRLSGASGCGVPELHQGVVGFVEAELPVERVCVGGVQQPTKVSPGSGLDHLSHKLPPQTPTTVLGFHVDIGEVGERNVVRNRSAEADHLAGGRIAANDPPSASHLLLDVSAGPPTSPIGLVGEEAPHRLHVHANGSVVELVLDHLKQCAVSLCPSSQRRVTAYAVRFCEHR